MASLRPMIIMICLALAAFLISLDSFIINVAITTISGEIGVRRDTGVWLITVFTMGSTLFVPFSARLAEIIGSKKVFLLGLFIFSFASFLCGYLDNFAWLLFFRMIQGVGGGLILPVSLSLIIQSFPPEKRSVAIGFWSFFVMVGPAMGPMIGGWLSDTHWHWLFFCNPPIGIFIFFTVWLLLEEKEQLQNKSFDIPGFLLLGFFLFPLQIACNRGQLDDWFRSIFIPSMFLLAFVSFGLFLIHSIQKKNAFLDLNFFAKINFLLPSFTTGIAMGMLFSSFVLEALWTYQSLGYTPAWSGLSLAPVGIFPLIMYPLIGRILPYINIKILVIFSFLLYAATFYWLSHLNVEISFSYLILPRLIQGIGFALFTVPNASIVLQGVKEESITFAISLFSFVRLFFVGIIVALGTALWAHREAFYQSRITEKTYENNPFFQQLIDYFSGLPLEPLQSLNLAYDAVMQQASTLALADIYYLFALIFLVLTIPILFYQKPLQKQKAE